MSIRIMHMGECQGAVNLEGEDAMGVIGELEKQLEKLIKPSNRSAEAVATKPVSLCQGCSMPLLGGGFCRECKANDACRCQGCDEPLKKTKKVSTNAGEKATKRGARCGRCKAVVYCSRACQKTDWSQHKLVCI